MTIVFEHSIEVPQSPGTVFALLDDYTQAPLWLTRCEGLAKQGRGPNAVGDKLRYAYKQGGHHGVMDGVIVAHEPDQLLDYKYYDKMMHVSVTFRMEPVGEGTRLIHRIDITPHSFMARLMSPFIRKALPQQTRTIMENIRNLLAGEA